MNPWDKLSGTFDTHKNAPEIDPAAADNILIAWPVLLQGIATVQPSGEGLTAFDFGCGTGSFAQALHARGYRVSAADTSEKMILCAKAHLGETIVFHVASADVATTLSDAPFALITSVMALPFIHPIEATLDALDRALRPRGVLAFVVFNPDFIRSNTGAGGLFLETTTPSHPTMRFMVMEDMRIPVYARTANEYDAMLKRRGYERVLCRRPRFTRAFLDRYPQEVNTRFSEYLILVYRKR